MRALNSTESQYKMIIDILKENPNFVKIVTYNIQALFGQGMCAEVLKQLEKFQTEIIVSIPPENMCCPDCNHCRLKNAQRFNNIIEHTHLFPKITWTFTKDSHAKLFYFDTKNPKAIIGGRNLTNSNWIDFSFLIDGDDAKQVLHLIQNTQFINNNLEERNAKIEPPTDKQLWILNKNNIKYDSNITKSMASYLISCYMKVSQT